MNSLVYFNVRSSASARNLNHSEYSPGALSKSLTFLKHTETISFCNSRRSSEPVSLQLGAGIQPPHCTATNKGFPLKADVVCSDTSNEFYCSWRSVSVPLLDTTRTYLRPNLCAACFDNGWSDHRTRSSKIETKQEDPSFTQTVKKSIYTTSEHNFCRQRGNS